MSDAAVRSREVDLDASSRAGRYGAFISYRHVDPDRQWARWLHGRLETYRVPGKLVQTGAARRIGRVFRDEEELSASSDLSRRIDDALEESAFLIVVCSRKTPESRWVNEEVKRFQAAGRADRILALLIEGEPNESFPPALRDREPLAADVRPTAGESARAIRKTAALKLLSAVLGVHYDELRRREEQRARLRLSRIAAGASLLSVILLVLSLVAWAQWQRAERELRHSSAQRLAAESRVAYVSTPASEAYGLAGPERGVLLALESLNALPTIEGDLALRTGLRMLAGDPLEIPIEEDELLAAIGPHGRWLLLTSPIGSRILDIATNAYHDSLVAVGADHRPVEPAAIAEPPDGTPEAIARSPDGAVDVVVSELVECATEDTWVFACIGLRRATSGAKLADLPHDWFVRLAAFSADARWLLTVTGAASADAEDPAATVLVGHTVHVWEVATGREVSRIPLAQDGGIDQAAISPDGGWLATTSRTPDGTVVRLWPLWPELVRGEACLRLTRNLSPSEWKTFVGARAARPTCPGLPAKSE